jgi:hypothetical protein
MNLKDLNNERNRASPGRRLDVRHALQRAGLAADWPAVPGNQEGK